MTAPATPRTPDEQYRQDLNDLWGMRMHAAALVDSDNVDSRLVEFASDVEEALRFLPEPEPSKPNARWFCQSCGAAKPDARPGVACPAGCGSSVTTNRRPA